MGRRNFLVEGVSGTGKTAVCTELQARGFHAVHGDRELAYQGDPLTGQPVHGVTGLAVHDHHLWRVDQVRRLVEDRDVAATFLCGGSRNWSSFLHLFDEVLVLQVDRATLERRLDARPEDEWGGRPAERDLVLRAHGRARAVPPGTVVDATAPLDRVVDEVLRRAGLLDPAG